MSAPTRKSTGAAALLLLAPLAVAAGPADPAEPERSRVGWAPPIADASGEAETALSTFTLPEGVTGAVWAAEPLLANPVAIDVDHRGRVFVAETWRQKKGVEDNRSHMEWLRRDLAAQTVEDRLAYIRDFIDDPEAEYGTAADLVRLVEDRDGDGAADTSRVFAGGFDDILDGTGAGVLARPDGTVYFTCIPDLYALRDLDGDGEVVGEAERGSLHTGYGVRFAFRGHDMHGLIVGPDGRLYWTIGDRGFHVVTPEGTTLHQPDRGAVFRSELDGTGLEIVHTGLRNPQELAFDDEGNLFTWDNNSDSGDHARWVHVLQGADSGWRIHYQYLEDRGPWNREMTWFPSWWQPGDGTSSPAASDRSDDPTTATGAPNGIAAAAVRPAYVFPPVAMIGDGPSGIVYDTGVGLDEKYRGHFFACDFRGTPNQSGIRHWTNDADGATFRIAGAGKYVWGILATDAAFHPDGSLFATDWVTGWEGVGKGRIYRFADEDAVSPQSAALLEMDYGHLDEPRLAAMLNNVDRRVRQEAQLELAARNATDTLLAVAEDATADPLARRHALWGYGECVRRHAAPAADLAPFAGDADPILRWWAVRLLGELAPEKYATTITDALRDDDPRVVREAALAATEAVAAGWLNEALTNFPDDPAIFHACTVGLSKTQSPMELAAGLGAYTHFRTGWPEDRVYDFNLRQDLAAIVAIRRTGSADGMLRAMELAAANANEVRVWLEMVRAVVDDPVDGADRAGLRRVAEWGANFHAGQEEPVKNPAADAVLRRTLMAGLLLGRDEDADRAFHVAAMPNVHENLRVEALAELAMWGTPDRLDRVTGRLRPAAEWAAAADVNKIEDGEVVRSDAAVSGALFTWQNRLLEGPPAVQAAAIDLFVQHDYDGALDQVRAIATDAAAPAKLRVTAIEAVHALADADAALAVARVALNADTAVVRAAGRAVLVERDPAGAVPALADALDSGEPVERQQAVATLARLETAAADDALKPYLAKLSAGDAPPEITLELLEAAANRTGGGFGEYLAMYEDLRGPDKVDAWAECVEGGDKDAGNEIFYGRSAVGCLRCHQIGGAGGAVGPRLDGIGARKDRRYLLESIVHPDAKIAEGFATAVVLTDEGAVRTGVVKEETDEALTLVLPTGEEVRIAAGSILDRATGASAMPADIPDALTKREMRDLVAFLATLTDPPAKYEAEGGGHE